MCCAIKMVKREDASVTMTDLIDGSNNKVDIIMHFWLHSKGRGPSGRDPEGRGPSGREAEGQYPYVLIDLFFYLNCGFRDTKCRIYVLSVFKKLYKNFCFIFFYFFY